jgi:hypothetical protein
MARAVVLERHGLWHQSAWLAVGTFYVADCLGKFAWQTGVTVTMADYEGPHGGFKWQSAWRI